MDWVWLGTSHPLLCDVPGMFRFFYVNVLTFPDGENRASSHRQARNLRSNPVWNPEIGHARIAEPMFTPPSSLGKKNVFSYLFFAVFFLGLRLQRIPVRNVNFWKPFFAYHGVPMATQKKQHIISLYERYLKTTQPSTWNGWSNHLLSNAGHLRGGGAG